MTRRRVATLAVLAMLVLAGCSAPGGSASEPTASSAASTAGETATPTETPMSGQTPSSRVTVYGDLPVNATLIWERVESLLGDEYDPPTVAVRERTLEPQTDEFGSHLGFDRGIIAMDDGRVRGSYARRTGRVRISPRNGSTADIARVLAHEYVHAAQYGTGSESQSTFLDRVVARDGYWLQRALIEGSAVYVEDIYTQEYLGFSAIEQRCAEYENGSPYERYAGQPYCFGGQYFAETLDSPSELLSPNTTLPNTTEQVLHPGRTEPPANLTVVDETPTDWYTPASFRRQGELFVQTVLGVELSEERASGAAAGWGNDRLVEVTGDTEGYVWVLRWDTAKDADEFKAAFADYLDARGERADAGWRVDNDRYRLTTIDERTVAVVTGNETFVDTVSVTDGDGNVTVSADR